MLYSIVCVVIIGLYMGFINFWMSVVGHIYKTLEMFFVGTFLLCQSILTSNDLEIVLLVRFPLPSFCIILFLDPFSLGSAPLSCEKMSSLLFRSIVIHVVEPTIHGCPS
jgi:hypothetical protein